MALKSSAGALMLRSAEVYVDDDTDDDRTDHYTPCTIVGVIICMHTVFLDDVRQCT